MKKIKNDKIVIIDKILPMKTDLLEPLNEEFNPENNIKQEDIKETVSAMLSLELLNGFTLIYRIQKNKIGRKLIITYPPGYIALKNIFILTKPTFLRRIINSQ